MMMKRIKIELQYFHGCPNAEQMIINVRNAIRNLAYNIDYQEVLVEDNETAERLGFRGSPTLLINGKDLTGMPEPDTSCLACRVYPGGIPTTEQIVTEISSME